MKKYKSVFKEGDFYSLMGYNNPIVKSTIEKHNEIMDAIEKIDKVRTLLYNLNNNYLSAEEKYKNDMSSTKELVNLAKELEKEFNAAKSEVPKIVKLLHSYKEYK